MGPPPWKIRFAMPREGYSPGSFVPSDLWGSIFLLCTGVSLAAATVSASWTWAALSVGMIAVPAYLVAYRGVLGIIRFALATVLGGAPGIGWGIVLMRAESSPAFQPPPGFFWPLFVICAVGATGPLFAWSLSGVRSTLEYNESGPEEVSGALEDGCLIYLLFSNFFVALPLFLLAVILHWLDVSLLYNTTIDVVLETALVTLAFVACPISLGGSIAYVLWGIARHRRLCEKARRHS